MLLRLSCRIGLPARQRTGSGDLRDRATGDVLDTAPRRAAADAASPARRRPRWRAAHSAKLFAPVPHGRSVPVAREGEERTGRQGRARPSPSRPATPAIRRPRLADGSPLNAASYALPVNPVLRAWSSRSWVWPGSAQLLVRGLWPPGRPGRRPSRPLPRRATRPARRCGPWWRKPASSEAANVGPEAVLLSAMAGLEDALAVAVESTAARVTRQRAKSDRTPSDWYRYAGMAELADATDLKSVTRKGVWVRLPLPALVVPAT